MPSHASSTGTRTRSTLAPLAIPSSSRLPTSTASHPPSPLASPLADERRPLLRSVRSFGPEQLKRTTGRFSALLFAHGDDPSSPLEPPQDAHGAAVRSPVSPGATSFFGRAGSLRRRPTGYDGEFRKELEGDGGNGVRSWYDWIHDAIKDSIRLRRLRRLKRTHGLRGHLVNLWDASLGWLLVSVIGFLTACIAFAIVRSEMWLFDLKEGYCADGWSNAKRFCCRSVEGAALRSGSGSTSAFTAFLYDAGEAEDGCYAWRTWAQVWRGWSGQGEEAGEVANSVAYVVLALAFATFASWLTIYFTASTSVFSSKDSPSIPHPGFSPDFYDSLSNASSHGDEPNDGPGSKYGATDGLAVPGAPAAMGSNGSAAGMGENGMKEEQDVLLVQRPRKTLYFAAGSGIPEVKAILSGLVIRGYLGVWTLAVKAVGLAFSVASGLSLGKEGPLVQIAAATANVCSRFVRKYDRNEAKRREVLSAGCAAGVAVAFGAPVGGVLFSLEEVSYFFPPRTMLRSFWCAMIAAMTLRFLNPFGSGKIVLFEVTYDRDWHAFELLGFGALAVFGGVYGACFCRANIAWTKHVRNKTFLKSHPIVEVALVTLLTVAISMYNPWSKMGGTELISTLFSECHKSERLSGLCISTPSQVGPLIASIAAALVLKAAVTTITFGIKLPAGIFIPTLAVGACAGRIAGLVVEVLHAKYPTSFVFDACRPHGGEEGPLPFGQACVVPGVWAMIGAAATLAGVTRTTVSLAVIVFELTGTLTYSVPTMLAVTLAKTVADRIEPRSIYDLVIEVADLPYLDAKTEYIHDSTPAEVLDASAPTISLASPNTLGSLRAKLAALYTASTASGFPIVAPENHDADESASSRMYAYIASKELEHGLSLARAQGLPDHTRCTFRSAEVAWRGSAEHSREVSAHGGEETVDFGWLTDQAPMFAKLGLGYIVVVDERGLYLGVIEKNTWLHYLRWLEKRAHERTLASWRSPELHDGDDEARGRFRA
ncbi:hypothetical protein Rhopal_004718-T1 [Rhodotorula paludigena]|uniref:Chloride channel protein n=1 Tax=Rhodotorula paludigena TaxID=86838 RepID=A0AAV5GQA4_9BASI|nr:hypothetical protein Rhopal_004718-T1 [Rhodotorula paludigena]